jgi:hypothetical protein
MSDTLDHDELAAKLEAAGKSCGLYLAVAHVAVPDPDDPEIPEGAPTMVTAQFDVGNLAFSSRVLDPETEATNKEFRDMAVDYRRDEVKRIAREGMSGALAELEDDDENEV